MEMEPEIPMPEPQFLLDGFRAEAGDILDTDGQAGRVVNLLLVLRAAGYPDQPGFTLQVAVPEESAPALAGAVLLALRHHPAGDQP
jgi:hypothetical protein